MFWLKLALVLVIVSCLAELARRIVWGGYRRPGKFWIRPRVLELPADGVPIPVPLEPADTRTRRLDLRPAWRGRNRGAWPR